MGPDLSRGDPIGQPRGHVGPAERREIHRLLAQRAATEALPVIERGVWQRAHTMAANSCRPLRIDFDAPGDIAREDRGGARTSL